MLSFWAKLCCNVLDTSSNWERMFDTLSRIEWIEDVDFLYDDLADLRDCTVLLRIFDVLAFISCNSATLLVIDFIVNYNLIKINL